MGLSVNIAYLDTAYVDVGMYECMYVRLHVRTYVCMQAVMRVRV